MEGRDADLNALYRLHKKKAAASVRRARRLVLSQHRTSVGFPPALLMPAHVMIAIMAPGVIMLGMLSTPRRGFLGVPPSMPTMLAVPIAVSIAEGYAAAGADRDRYIISHYRRRDGSSTEQCERDESTLDWGFHDYSSLIINA